MWSNKYERLAMSAMSAWWVQGVGMEALFWSLWRIWHLRAHMVVFSLFNYHHHHNAITITVTDHYHHHHHHLQFQHQHYTTSTSTRTPALTLSLVVLAPTVATDMCVFIVCFVHLCVLRASVE